MIDDNDNDLLPSGMMTCVLNYHVYHHGYRRDDATVIHLVDVVAVDEIEGDQLPDDKD
jgi:hypothetical protein